MLFKRHQPWKGTLLKLHCKQDVLQVIYNKQRTPEAFKGSLFFLGTGRYFPSRESGKRMTFFWGVSVAAQVVGGGGGGRSSGDRGHLKSWHTASFPYFAFGSWEGETMAAIATQPFGIQQALGPVALLRAWKPKYAGIKCFGTLWLKGLSEDQQHRPHLEAC